MSQTILSTETRALFGPKTRGRILEASLVEFNTYGYNRVTTAQIAGAAEVLEGTLWYHFKAKNDLILAHLDVLETRLNGHLEVGYSQTPIEVIRYIYGIFDILWDFRYLLRDPLEYVRHDPAGIARAKAMVELLEDRTAARLQGAADIGILDLENANLDRMVVTTIMTGRYWLDYAMTRHGGNFDLNEMKAEGLALILEIQKPYLNGEFREIVSSSNLVGIIQNAFGSSD